ncbi:MAG: TlpA family protein disulfide reductase [Promethearchaeota archaeon]
MGKKSKKHQKRKKTTKRKVKIKSGKSSQNFPWIIVLVIVVICIGVGGALVFFLSTPPSVPPDSNGTNLTRAPGFSLTSIDGEDFSLSGFRGQVVVLDLMGTTCIPCIEQMEHLHSIDGLFEDSIQIISISVSGDSDEQLRQFASDHNIDWLVARDTDNVGIDYSVRFIPTIVIIDQDGYLRNRHSGIAAASVLQDEINVLLNDNAFSFALILPVIEGLSGGKILCCLPFC